MSLLRNASDRARLDWLERHTVNVRVALVHGSRDLFWASPDDSYEGEIGPSDIRAKIDAAMWGFAGSDTSERSSKPRDEPLPAPPVIGEGSSRALLREGVPLSTSTQHSTGKGEP